MSGIKGLFGRMRALWNDLIETNIRQRGIGNPNPIKLSRCIKELERIYGIEHGGNHGNQYSMPSPKVSDLPTQEDLANMIGISVDTLNNYKKLTEMIPEFLVSKKLSNTAKGKC